jgi:multiple sugar transport system permease protein
MFPTPIQHASRSRQVLYFVLLPLSLVLWLLPLAAVAWTSVRSIDDLNRGNVWGWPSGFRLVENYGAVLSGSGMGQFILNSFVIVVPTVIGAIAISSMAGFALAKYRFRGNLVLLAIFLGGNLVPYQVLMIPVRHLMVDVFGLYDTRLGLILFHTAFQTGFCTLFMRNFIRQLPDALFDAARIDGMSELRIFWSIALPLVRPALGAIAGLIFTFVWNDYFWALVLVHSDDVRPVTAGLQSMRGMWLASWHLISAGSILAALPPLAVFFVMQRHLISGLSVSTAQD